MTAHVVVPAGYNGELTVLGGMRLLSGVGEQGLSAHRTRWGTPVLRDAEALVELTGSAELRGRGGAAFPFGRKLAAAVAAGQRRSVVVNASEGEPGSAKDSALLLTVPHLVLDGAAIVARALDVALVHLIVPGERPAVREAAERAIAESDTGLQFTVLETTGGFVGGQARAVLELISGRENLPVTAWEPEAVSGLQRRPTLLSNAETFAQVAALSSLGAAEYARYGTADEPGTTLLTVGGDGPSGVVLEAPFGLPIAEVLRYCGHDVSAPLVMGGYHGAWLTPSEVGARLVSRVDLARSGATLGAGVMLPVDRNACPLVLTSQVVDYLAGQSARRCGPCLNGLPALAEACRALAAGRAGEIALRRIDELVGLLPGRGACAHPDGTVRLVRSMVRAFQAEIEAHVYGDCHLLAALPAVPPPVLAHPNPSPAGVTSTVDPGPASAAGGSAAQPTTAPRGIDPDTAPVRRPTVETVGR